jgi:hypothetical protein
MCVSSLKKNGWILKFVPEKFKTQEFFEEIFLFDNIFNSIPEKFKTPAMCKQYEKYKKMFPKTKNKKINSSSKYYYLYLDFLFSKPKQNQSSQNFDNNFIEDLEIKKEREYAKLKKMINKSNKYKYNLEMKKNRNPKKGYNKFKFKF